MKKILALVLCVIMTVTVMTSAFAVKIVPLTDMTFSDQCLVFKKIGDAITMKVSYEPADTTQKTVKFSSSNTNVATVSSKGRVTAKGYGYAVITGSTLNKSVVKKTAVYVIKPEVKTIDYLAYNTYAQPDTNSEILKKIENMYNIKFNFWFVDDQKWDELLGVKFASGDMPDIFKVKNTAMLPKYVNMGVCAEITKEMRDKFPNVYNYPLQYAGEDAYVDTMIKGKQYAFKSVNLNGSYPTALVWRKDWLENVGIKSIPSTLQEWENAMIKFRNNDPDKNKKKDTYGMSNTTMNAIFGAYGAIPIKEYRGTGTQQLFWTKKSNKYVYAATQPETKQALNTLAKWYKMGLIDPEFVTGENTGGYWAASQAFENGKVGVTGMSMIYHWNPPLFNGSVSGGVLQTYLNANPSHRFGENVDFGKAPVGPEGKSGTHCWGAVNTSGTAFSTKLVKDQDKLDRVLCALEDLNTDYDLYTMTQYGLEGKTYKVDKTSGSYATTPEYSTGAAMIKAGIQINFGGANPVFQKTYNPLLYKFMDKYKTKGYQDMLVPQTDAATKYQEDLKKLTLETFIRIISGEKPVSYFDEYVKLFNSKGGDEIVKQVNDAIN